MLSLIKPTVCNFFFRSQGIKCVQKFVQHPTYVSTYITKQQDAAFPAVTVCPEKSSYKSDVLEVGKFPEISWALGLHLLGRLQHLF